MFRSKLDSNENSLIEADQNLSSMFLQKSLEELMQLDGIGDSKSFLEAFSKEDLFTLLIHSSRNIKKLEIELKETKKCSRKPSYNTEAPLIFRQPLDGSRKNSCSSSPFKFKEETPEDLINQLQESEQELIEVVDKLQQENVLLRTRIEDLEENKADFEQQKLEFYEKRESFEEVCDFQKQELAKIKHMLITREKEAMTLQSELNEAVSDLMKSKERNEEAESMLFETVKKNETLQREFDDVKCENILLKKKFDEVDGQYKIMQVENFDMKKSLSFLNGDLRKVRRSLSNAEVSQRSASDKYEYLKHNSQAVLNKAQSDLEEKENLISELDSKLRIQEEKFEEDLLSRNKNIKTLQFQTNFLTKELKSKEDENKMLMSERHDLTRELKNIKNKLAEKTAAFDAKLTQSTQKQQRLEEDYQKNEKILMLNVDELSERLQQSKDILENLKKLKITNS